MQRLSTRSLAASMFGLLAVCLAGLPARLGVVGAFVAELLLLVSAVALALRAARPWLEGASSRTPLRLATLFLVAIGIGQIVRTKKAFPLMPYTMYARAAEGEATFYEYRAQRRSGARERFRPSRIIATLGRARIVKGLARELDAIAELEAGGRDASRPRARATALIRALIGRQNSVQPEDPVTQVEVVRVVLPPPYEPEGAQRRTVTMIAAEPPP